MKKDDTVYLRHIFDAINKIEEYTVGMNKESFFASDKTQDAVIRQFEIIGKRQKELPSIPAQIMVAFRGKIWPGCAISSSVTILA